MFSEAQLYLHGCVCMTSKEPSQKVLQATPQLYSILVLRPTIRCWRFWNTACILKRERDREREKGGRWLHTGETGRSDVGNVRLSPKVPIPNHASLLTGL